MPNPESFIAFLGDAVQTEFARTCTIFGIAAWVHAKQVRTEIRRQFGELVSVLREDLEGQKFLIGTLTNRVTKLEHAILPAGKKVDE